MTRDTFNYTHGDTGTAPASSLNFDKNERPQAGNFDWYWYNAIEAIKGHADEFTRLDSNDDGVVDETDTVTAGGNLKGDLNAVNGETIWNESATYIPQGRLQNDSVSVAGQSVSLGGSTTLGLSDLDDYNVGHNDLVNVTEIRDGGTTIRIDDGNNRVEFEDNNNNRTDILSDRIYLEQGAGWFTGDHSELQGVGSSDHHTRYSDSEAQTAVDGSNVSVGYADSAGNADTVDGNNASELGNSDQEIRNAVDGSSLSSLDITGKLGVPQYSDPSSGQSNTAEGDIFYSQSDNSLYLNDGA